MNKTELEILSTLLGRKQGPIRTMPSSYRGCYGTRQHKVCMELEKEGLGRIEMIDRVAFRFSTHAMLHEAGRLG